jgi:selenocysteine lyase/cysteine desulfurase
MNGAPGVAAGALTMTDFSALRSRFPLLAEKTYLNSGSYAALADSVRAAFVRYLDERLEVGANWDVWVTKNEAVRRAIAAVLHADPDEVAVTTSTTAGLNAVASALDFTGPRDTVITTDLEFPTNAQIWHAQEPRGARVLHVPRDPDGCISPDRFAEVIDERTKLVAITHVGFRSGARLDVAEISRIAHERGALVLLDCYQSVGSMSLDVHALDLDFAVGGMYKYLLATAGIGFLYVRGSLVPHLVPTHSGWFAQADIAAMNIASNCPSPSARRFEAGSPPVAAAYAAEAALAIILEVGTDAIEARVRELTGQCMDRLVSIGWAPITPRDDDRRGAMIAIPSGDSTGLDAALAERGIVVSHRDRNIRAGFHFYNNEDDVDVFIGAMTKLKEQFAP